MGSISCNGIISTVLRVTIGVSAKAEIRVPAVFQEGHYLRRAGSSLPKIDEHESINLLKAKVVALLVP